CGATDNSLGERGAKDRRGSPSLDHSCASLPVASRLIPPSCGGGQRQQSYPRGQAAHAPACSNPRATGPAFRNLAIGLKWSDRKGNGQGRLTPWLLSMLPHHQGREWSIRPTRNTSSDSTVTVSSQPGTS